MEKQKQTTEEKLDMILSQVLTNQGQVAILQGQMKAMEARLEEKLDQKLDKKFTEFKRDLGTFLGGIFQEAEDKIDKNEREIKKLPCVSFKTRLKKFVSKTN